MKDRTTLQLASRLNEIMKELEQLELIYIKQSKEYEKKRNDLDIEYNKIVYELWQRIPSLKVDVNIQPKKKVRKYDINE